MGKPGICRNDRFWLAGDHLVDPRVLDKPKIKAYVDAADRAKKEFKMTENQGMNVGSDQCICRFRVSLIGDHSIRSCTPNSAASELNQECLLSAQTLIPALVVQ